jgi:hypothetical protein
MGLSPRARTGDENADVGPAPAARPVSALISGTHVFVFYPGILDWFEQLLLLAGACILFNSPVYLPCDLWNTFCSGLT